MTDEEIEILLNLPDYVYVYEFPEQNTVYVGRTINPERRDKEHRTNEYVKKDGSLKYCNSSIYKFSKKNKLEIPPMKIVVSDITVREGQRIEGEIVDEYKKNGWKILNIGAVGEGKGSLGGLFNSVWSINKITEEAKKYNSRSDFFKYAKAAYLAAQRQNILTSFEWFEEYKLEKYFSSKENVFNEAKKYNSKSMFKDKNRIAYNMALNNGWLDEMDFFKKLKYWSDEEILNESKKYASKREFELNNPRAYNNAIVRDLLKEMTWLPEHNQTYMIKGKIARLWDIESVFDESKKYKNIEEFRRKSKKAYTYAYEHNLLKQMIWLLDEDDELIKISKMSDDEILEISKQFKTRDEFKKSFFNIYRESFFRKLLNQMIWLENTEVEKRVIDISKKYTYLSQFRKECKKEYLFAKKYNLLEIMKWLIDDITLTEESVIKISKRFNSLYNFKVIHKKAFNFAEKHNLIKDMDWFIDNTEAFTNEIVFKISKRYVSLSRFKFLCKKAYKYAEEHNILKDMIWFNDNQYAFTDEMVLDISKNYETLSKFKFFNKKAYKYAEEHNLLKKMIWLRTYNRK